MHLNEFLFYVDAAPKSFTNCPAIGTVTFITKFYQTMNNVVKHECPSNVWLSVQLNFIFHERKNQILFT